MAGGVRIIILFHFPHQRSEIGESSDLPKTRQPGAAGGRTLWSSFLTRYPTWPQAERQHSPSHLWLTLQGFAQVEYKCPFGVDRKNKMAQRRVRQGLRITVTETEGQHRNHKGMETRAASASSALTFQMLGCDANMGQCIQPHGGESILGWSPNAACPSSASKMAAH